MRALAEAKESIALSKRRVGGQMEGIIIIKKKFDITGHHYGGLIMNYKYFESTFVIIVLPPSRLPNLVRHRGR